MTHAASARVSAADLAMIADIEHPAPAHADTPEYQDKLSRAAAASRATLQAAIERKRSGATSAAELLDVYLDLERRCLGNRDVLDLLLRHGATPESPAHEMWFEVGLAAAETGQMELTADIGRMLAVVPIAGTASSLPQGLPSIRARGLHLLMLTEEFPESRSLAKRAKKAYILTKCLAPPEVWARLKAPRVDRPAAAVGAVPAGDAEPAGSDDDDNDNDDDDDGDDGDDDTPAADASAAGDTPAAAAPAPTQRPAPAPAPTQPPRAAPPAGPLPAPFVAPPAAPGETLSMPELVALLRDVGETKVGGGEISRHAVRARLRYPADAPPEYADLAQLRNPETGRFPKAEALAVVERISRRVRAERGAPTDVGA